MNKEIRKCRFKHCLCDDRYVDKSIAIKDGNSYYHKECYNIKNDIAEIIDLFIKNINQNVVFSVLNKVINDIVFNKKNDSKFLLFGLKYYITNKIPLNYPQGLYYVIQNKDVKNTYLKFLKKNEIKEKVIIEEIKDENSFVYIAKKPKGFDDILQ